jgi:hypothetical protein
MSLLPDFNQNWNISVEPSTRKTVWRFSCCYKRTKTGHRDMAKLTGSLLQLSLVNAPKTGLASQYSTSTSYKKRTYKLLTIPRSHSSDIKNRSKGLTRAKSAQVIFFETTSRKGYIYVTCRPFPSKSCLNRRQYNSRCWRTAL